MAASVQEIIAGRKTFFIAPDLTLVPESFCEEYLADGFECYFIENDKRIALQKKIEIIISVFHDVILFFNIDAQVPGIKWPELIGQLQEKYGTQILIGVFYGKRQSREERTEIERFYLFNLGIICGCIQLEYQKKLNFGIIEKVLFANQAMGRRKSVRALGSNGTTFGFLHNGVPYSGVLQDISLSHFSFVFPQGKLEMKQFEKLHNIQFNIKGLHFSYNAIMFMQRDTAAGDSLFVCMFISKDGAKEMDIMTRQLLSPRLYEIMNERCTELMFKLYDKYKELHPANALSGKIENSEKFDDLLEAAENIS